MQVALMRLDIHPGDSIQRTSFEVDDAVLLSSLLREHLAPFVPRLTWTTWTFIARCGTHGYHDVAEVGAQEDEDRLLVEDVPIGQLEVEIFDVGAIPTAELLENRAREAAQRAEPPDAVGNPNR